MAAHDCEIRNRRTVLFVTNAYSYGGSEKHLLELLHRIDRPDIQSIILSTDADPFTERLTAVPPRIAVRCEKGVKSLGDWFRLFREIRPDVVVLVYGTLWMLPPAAALGARLAGVPKLYAIEHLMPLPPGDPEIRTIRTPRDLLRKLFGKRVRKILGARIPPHLGNRTICVSDAVRDALVREYRFPARKMLTIRNGVSIREFQPDPGDGAALRTKWAISPADFLLVCTARLSPEKGIDVLLSALGRIVPRHPSCKCLIVGEGTLREELLDEVQRLGLGQHVFFAGFQADVRPFLHAADAFILTSHVEGLPFSVLEAMACGLPCIVTNVGGTAEAVVHNRTGRLVPPGSVDEVVQAISHILAHPEERAQMGRESRLRAATEFDIEARMADVRRVILA